LQDRHQHIQLDKRRYIFSNPINVEIANYISVIVRHRFNYCIISGNIETCIPFQALRINNVAIKRQFKSTTFKFSNILINCEAPELIAKGTLKSRPSVFFDNNQLQH
jgi:hypothetical protein